MSKKIRIDIGGVVIFIAVWAIFLLLIYLLYSILPIIVWILFVVMLGTIVYFATAVAFGPLDLLLKKKD